MTTSIATRTSGYLQKPELAKAAFERVRNHDGSLFEAADKAFQRLAAMRAGEAAGGGGAATAGQSDPTAPTLTAPAPAPAPAPDGKEELTGSGKLTLLLGRLVALLGEVSASQLEARLATWQAMMSSTKAMGEKLSGELTAAVGESRSATTAYEAALQTLTSATAAKDAATQALAQKQAALAALKPDAPGYAAAKTACDQAMGQVASAVQAHTQAKAEADRAHTFAIGKAAQADRLLTQAQRAASHADVVGKNDEEVFSNAAKLTMLMSTFITLVGKNNEESLKNDLSFFQELQKGRQAEMDKKSEDYEQEVRKAEELNRVMGCVGKILGAVIAAVSVVAAAFTGGASLALAAIGVALMVADEVVKAATGVSFMEKALSPLMDHVLKPLMDLITKGITKALEAFGMDAKEAAKVGSIVGGIVAAVAMVVVMVVVFMVGKGAASRIASSIGKMVTDTINKILPKLLTKMQESAMGKLFTQLSLRVTTALAKKGLTVTAESKELLGNTLAHVALGGEVVNSLTQSGGTIAHGVMSKDASDDLAAFTLAHADFQQLSEMLKRSVDVFGENQKIVAEITKTMSAAIQQDAEAGRFVLRRSRA